MTAWTPEATHRAGRYQAEWARKGRTIETPDALVARAHGAVLVTHNTNDFRCATCASSIPTVSPDDPLWAVQPECVGVPSHVLPC